MSITVLFYAIIIKALTFISYFVFYLIKATVLRVIGVYTSFILRHYHKGFNFYILFCILFDKGDSSLSDRCL